MAVEEVKFPENAYRMYFTTNHDENSWAGSDIDMYGESFQNFAVLSATIDGMPLIYNGQESGLDKQLEFFEKDEIEWEGYKYQDLYTMLLELKKNNEPLWNGQYGGEFVRIDSPETTYAFKRVKGEDEVIVFINNTNEEVSLSVELNEDLVYKSISKGLTESTISSASEAEISADAKGWIILATE